MVYKRFRVVVLARVLLLSGTLYLFFYLLLKPDATLYATIFILGLIIVYQIYSLIHYVEKTNRDLKRFLLTIKHEDFSQTFLGQGLGSTFDELKAAFNDIIQKFHEARAEKEEHFRYLQTVVQHVGIGLIAFTGDGKVALLNNAAKKLLKIPRLKNIQHLERYSQPLVEKLFKLRSGQKALVKIEVKNELLQLAINTTEFRMRDQNYTLVSLQNIQSELEEKELEAWQNLIRVLTHEIMNSVTPIASLASTVNELLNSNGENGVEEFVSPDVKNDIHGAMHTIQKRSDGLLHFVDAYRDLARLPKPKFQIFGVMDLLQRVEKLMAVEISEKSIGLDIRVIPESLELTADPQLIEQILINIVKNAIQALNGKPDARIELLSKIDDGGRIIIQVKDNGPGIPQDMQEKIFIPFFTTKEDGTGIGLSLSRQIMRLHKGSISVHSKSKDGTVFTLRF
ncbi:HAMP domain-containing histidine kinase [candidate division KSB1 bacterium]|nr:HAMP domain-containing histidine kinase [candidate division KSB1 bacterium]NIR70325.1 HAMP domain-containing histidine kinase [candidate division KSB1 bacterium]NIS27629.1 HAMP domain-containing histidine kinase [candidate division KSB1 bacterium]NIT74469.1 HAMP domain-containing histidine kinase [candidate division KSB1 bacterium]NIU28994.1 HAMP domain-containing histidine kinase [candidate division KSB1 bacterium]